eukprot:CAMPEP_0198257494 /NCGR_PEP_ID=MMETSP1447-20131203/7164_1 /TAXON_ID=420782 /ORGANISM="Chaetoceros dichaeta, Strain CCMP1751" /LENGTH=352 /DNA_ID=CAMNT_0043944413 /DNA_START=75 /DNA_END=1133 /DNA_ORIENTATION=+
MTSEIKELLDPPSFQLPSTIHNNHTTDDNLEYEVWSLRMPVQFDPSSLDGVSLSFNQDILEQQQKKLVGTVAAQQDNVLASFELSNDADDRYSLALGPTAETQSFRVLVPATNQPVIVDDDTNDDTEMSKKQMKLLPIPFTRHVTLIRSSKVDMTEFDLAPSKERAPKPRIMTTAATTTTTMTTMGEPSTENTSSKITMARREAYSHVDQVKGLKRRWSLFGSNVDMPALHERCKRRRERDVVERGKQRAAAAAAAADAVPTSTDGTTTSAAAAPVATATTAVAAPPVAADTSATPNKGEMMVVDKRDDTNTKDKKSATAVERVIPSTTKSKRKKSAKKKRKKSSKSPKKSR